MQVIYHLNKKNEELEFDCLELSDQHARDLATQEQQAQDKLSAVSAQLAEEAQRAFEQHSAAIQVTEHVSFAVYPAYGCCVGVINLSPATLSAGA